MSATTNCKICQSPFQFEPIEGLSFKLTPTVCDACARRRQESEEASQMEALMADFESICPMLYQDTDPNHPGMPEPSKLTHMLNWKYGPRGLVVRGKTRRGKTRSVWLLMKKMTLENRSVYALTSNEFATECADAHGGGYAGAWMIELVEADIVFIDDLGKSKLTERVEASLFELIERRTRDLKPIIFTTNFTTGNELLATMSTDRGPAIVSRIREFCDSVTL